VKVTVTTIHIVSTGPDWGPNWTSNSLGKQATNYTFMIPNSELQITRGMNYTIHAIANWNSGPLSHSDPADIEATTVTAL